MDEVCAFVDEIITCSSEHISEDLAKLQTHRHSHTCQKRTNTEECRFGIPYFPMKQTCILDPISENHTTSETRKYSKIMQKVKKQLLQEETKNMTHDQFLNNIEVTEKMYIMAIRNTLKKSQLFIKRSPKNIFISPYSTKIIQLMRSNVNVQFVLDAFGAATYIIDYINKSSRGMSNLMREVLKEVREGNDNLRES
ncbi:hypothetical protein FOCC_FOCC015416 [Frankliniella occidentalis]|nr:hypothetical protein FOCC_FOCC015416 [Frankliniella occidentalis]